MASPDDASSNLAQIDATTRRIMDRLQEQRVVRKIQFLRSPSSAALGFREESSDKIRSVADNLAIFDMRTEEGAALARSMGCDPQKLVEDGVYFALDQSQIVNYLGRFGSQAGVFLAAAAGATLAHGSVIPSATNHQRFRTAG